MVIANLAVDSISIVFCFQKGRFSPGSKISWMFSGAVSSWTFFLFYIVKFNWVSGPAVMAT